VARKASDVSRGLLRAKIAARNHYAALAAREHQQARDCWLDHRHTPAAALNVVGVGIGEKRSKGRYTGRACVTVYVAKKYAKSRVKQRDFVPQRISGVPTDVVGVGYPEAKSLPKRRRKVRPAQPGTSVGPWDYDWSMVGTFGVIVTDRANRNYILSNNHVLADENNVALGARISQPGPLDDEDGPNAIGRLSEFVPLRFGNARNWMDAAVARLYATVRFEKAIMGIGAPQSAGRARRNMRVRKYGRTTGLTEGIVRLTRFDLWHMQFDQGPVRIDDVLTIQGVGGPFSQAGDSGSAIVSDDNRVVGLLFGGYGNTDYAVPIQRILRRFQVRIRP
jgi:S1-C subfamily serine protease